MAVIYIDVLFAVNFIVDLILLWCCGKLAGIQLKKLRLFFGAAFGGLYSAVIFFPSLQYLQLFVIKIAASAIMLALSFKIISGRQFLKIMFSFYAVNIIFGGALNVFMMFFKNTAAISNGSLYFDLPFAKLILLTFLTAGIFYISLCFLRRFLMHSGSLCRITAEAFGKRAVFYGFVDTGNCLKEPVSGLPVIVAELSCLKSLFDEKTLTMLENGDISALCEMFGGIFALIPYNSVGCENGLMTGIRINEIKIEQEKFPPITADCFIGVYNGKLKNAMGYKAIINPNILRKGNYNEAA